jgi:hypothetical protein
VRDGIDSKDFGKGRPRHPAAANKKYLFSDMGVVGDVNTVVLT